MNEAALVKRNQYMFKNGHLTMFYQLSFLVPIY